MSRFRTTAMGGTINQVAGRTVHADGTVVPFEGKPLDKVIVKQHDLRYQVKSFTLPDVQVGSIVEYRYSFRYPDNEFIQPYWVMQRDLFQKRAFFKNTPYDFKRTNMSLILGNGQIATGSNWTSYMPKDHQPQLRTTPAAFWIDLQMDNIPAFVEEPFQQPATSLKWRVNFYYNSTSKVADFWKDAGKSWNKRVESFMGHKNGGRSGVTDGRRNRYTGTKSAQDLCLCFEAREPKLHSLPAEQEEHTLGLKANSGAEDVLRQRTGDHDDLSRLFVAMVRAAGIPARLMWVPDRNENFFDDRYIPTREWTTVFLFAWRDEGFLASLDHGTL